MTVVVWLFKILAIVVPIVYLLLYITGKSKKKNYVKALLIAIITGFSLFIVSLMLNLFNYDDIKERENRTTTTTTKITSTTESTTTKPTTPTTKKVDIEKEYAKVSEISGTKVDKGYTSKGYPIYEINGVTYVDGYLIANKSYFLPEDYVPTNTQKEAKGDMTVQCATCIDKTAYNAYLDMQKDAKKNGHSIWISSGFRSYITQRNIYNRNVTNRGKATADTFSARPGSSEHQTGLCFDLNTIDEAFGKSKEGKWVNDNAYKYGYIIRYPEGKTDETGYIYESWHLRYVGTDLSYQLYNDGNWITMEDYFGIDSKYTD